MKGKLIIKDGEWKIMSETRKLFPVYFNNDDYSFSVYWWEEVVNFELIIFDEKKFAKIIPPVNPSWQDIQNIAYREYRKKHYNNKNTFFITFYFQWLMTYYNSPIKK